jgi:hypothetical protein
MQNEKQNDVVSYVIKDQFVDTDRIDEILSQGHLLSRKELYAVKCCKSIERITKFYTTGGMMMYMTNRPTDRIKTEWSSKDFDSFSGRVHRENIPYDEAYITVINLDDEIVYFEHNGKLSDSELSKLKHIT